MTPRQLAIGLGLSLGLGASLLGASLLGATDAAAAYPERPITLVVPFAPGGANDSVARLVGNKLGALLGQNVVVENRPGGGTTIGTAAVARARPDGHTLLLVSAAHTITPHLLKSVPYRTLQDFAAISQLTRTAYVMVTGATSSFQRVADFTAKAQTPDGQITFASSGTGSAPHLAGQLFAILAGVRAAHVPYQGGAPALIGVLRADVDFYFSSISGARSLIESGQLRAIGVSSEKRLSLLPDLATMSELGLAGFAIDGWYGIIGPAGLPADIVATLAAAISKALHDPELVERLKLEGEEIVASSPEAFDSALRRDVERYGRIIADVGWKPH